MATTVDNLVAELIGELGPMVKVAKLDATTLTAENTSLLGPIRKAIIKGGGSIADPPSVTDDDVATVTVPFDTLVLYGKIFLIEKIWGNWPYVDMKSGEETQMLSQLAKRLQEKLAEIKEELKDPESVINEIEPGQPIIGIIKTGSHFPEYGVSYGPWGCL